MYLVDILPLCCLDFPHFDLKYSNCFAFHYYYFICPLTHLLLLLQSFFIIQI